MTVFPIEAGSRGVSDDFLISKWTTEDGLPQNTVTSIVQTRDGYMWIGTFGGLTKFDGVRFRVFDSANTPVLKSNRILSLFEDSFGKLWIGTDLGEIYVKDASGFKLFPGELRRQRDSVWSIVEDKQDNIFVSSDSGLERYSFDAGGTFIPGSGRIISNERTYGLYKHPDGSVWVRIQGRIYRIEGETLLAHDLEKYPVPVPDDILRLAFARDGSMLFGGWKWLGVSGNGIFKELWSLKLDVQQGGYAILTENGRNWLQMESQLLEFRGTETINHNLQGTVKSGSRVIFRDSEDNLWLGTNGDGLIRLTERTIGTLSQLEGFDRTNNFAMVEDRFGAVWIGGKVLQKIESGKVSAFRSLKGGGKFPIIKTLGIGRDDRLWAGGTTGLYYFENGQLVALPEFNDRELYSLFFDKEGALWSGGRDGLWRYAAGSTTHFTTENGLVHNSVHYIAQSKDGTIWIGTVGGVSRLRGGTFTNLTEDNGLSGNDVRAIHEDGDGTIWLGSYGGGIDRFRNNRMDAITTREGLYDNFVSRILSDDEGRFWILGNLGISAVSRDELNRVADRQERFVVSATYGKSDGMLSSEANGGHQPAGIKTHDGKLWFPMLEDIVTIDPAKTSRFAPQVMIESAGSRLSTDQRGGNSTSYVEGTVIRVDDGFRNLEIEYTGLSFTKPNKIRFFYKLEGLDDDWTDAAESRTAFYPYLPSGNYTFLVKAVSADGIWSAQTARLSIEVAKSFWQTWWFTVIVLLAVICAVALAYRTRIGQLRRRQLEQETFSKRLIDAHELERSRLASELHDALGQNLLVIKTGAKAGLGNLSDRKEVVSRLNQIVAASSNAIDETRTIVRDLSPQNVRRFGLTEAINNTIEQVQSSTGIIFKSKIDNLEGIFPERTEISIYRIVQEALNNIAKHSDSPRANIMIERIGSKTRINIEDFGRGFSVGSRTDSDTVSGGFGLESISQRVKLLGGELSITSVPSEGTRIQIVLPA
jgi:signal transduction histidine kinase/ligand-binding sensor domain-containing protein